MNRDDAAKILDEWVTKAFTRCHLLATESVMRAYAEKFGEDPDTWGLAGLLHDADWDAFPESHPKKVVERVLAFDDLPKSRAIAQAIASHGNGPNFKLRKTLLDHALFASDEITGFVMAVAFLRPGKLTGLTSNAVKKKLKAKNFAAAVSRDDIAEGPKPLGVTLGDHLELVITAMQGANLAL